MPSKFARAGPASGGEFKQVANSRRASCGQAYGAPNEVPDPNSNEAEKASKKAPPCGALELGERAFVVNFCANN